MALLSPFLLLGSIPFLSFSFLNVFVMVSTSFYTFLYVCPVYSLMLATSYLYVAASVFSDKIGCIMVFCLVSACFRFCV